MALTANGCHTARRPRRHSATHVGRTRVGGRPAAAPGPRGGFAEYKTTGKIKTEERFRLPGGWVSDTSPDVGAGYRLVATVTHHGAKMAAGHYTADVCREGTWLRFDDESVGVVEVDEVLGGEAYLLFYRRE